MFKAGKKNPASGVTALPHLNWSCGMFPARPEQGANRSNGLSREEETLPAFAV